MFNKKHLAVLMLAAGGLASGSAWAVDCATVTTIALWQANPVCIQQDKTWTFTNTDLPDTTLLTFGLQTLATGIDIHTLTMAFSPKVNNTALDLNYTISINPPTPKVFTGASLGVDDSGAPPSSTVTKELTNVPVTLTSTNGAATSEDLTGSLTSLTVNDHIISGVSGAIASVSNSFTESAVPEPTSLALMGLGLAGLGVWRRRKV